MADHFKTSLNEMCSMFSRGVRILSEGGGSMGFRKYHELGRYLSEFTNKTGFPKFPLQGETELAISRFFQVCFPFLRIRQDLRHGKLSYKVCRNQNLLLKRSPFHKYTNSYIFVTFSLLTILFLYLMH